MDGNRFFCDQAAHNGVYLLQHLVTKKLKSPEWQLTLPKLLCGLGYDEVLLPYRPIHASYQSIICEEDQAEEKATQETFQTTSTTIDPIVSNSQHLFTCVTKRWKSLEDLKASEPYQKATLEDILQNYFLNRLGILTRQQEPDATDKQFWHLMFIHQALDRVELLPPWSMYNLKLPWMKESIALFWMPQ